MYTLKKVLKFTPIERNEFIDEIIFYLENYFQHISILKAIEKMTDKEFNDYKYRDYLNPLGIDANIISDLYFDKNGLISYLKAIKTIE